MIKLKTTKLNFNTLITKKGNLDKMNEASNLITYIESKYSSKILDNYSLGDIYYNLKNIDKILKN